MKLRAILLVLLLVESGVGLEQQCLANMRPESLARETKAEKILRIIDQMNDSAEELIRK